MEVLDPSTASAEELAAWTALHSHAMTELLGSAPPPEELAQRLRTGRAGQNWCWAARSEPGGPIQGVAELRRQPYDPDAGLLRLYVAEPARRRGLGAGLREAAIKQARTLGMQRVRSHTLAGPEVETFARSDGQPRTLHRFQMQE